MQAQQIQLASVRDARALTDLLYPESYSQGGTLDGDFPFEKVLELVLGSEKVLLCKEQEELLGVMFCFSPVQMKLSPVVAAMTELIASAESYLVYGPVCIAEAARGKGVLRKMYAEMKRQTTGKSLYAFINQNNKRSLKAHEKLGFHVIQPFSVENEHFWIIGDS